MLMVTTKSLQLDNVVFFPKGGTKLFNLLTTDDRHIGLDICPGKDIGIVDFQYSKNCIPFD